MLLNIILNILIVALFLYSKLLPYQEKLNPQYKSIFGFFDNLFSFILKALKPIFQPLQIGQGLAVDMTQIILLIIFLLLNNLF